MTHIEVAVKAAQASGELLRKNFGCALKVDEALHHDLKLALDKESQDIIFGIIAESFPDHALVGPHFCISIALKHKDEIIVGVILDPMLNDLWTVEKGGKPYLNGEEISASPRTKLEESILYIGCGHTSLLAGSTPTWNLVSRSGT